MQRTFGPKTVTPLKSSQSSGNFDSSEADLAKREGILEERERQISEKQKLVDEKLTNLEVLRKDLVEKLEKVSKFSAEDAKKILLENLDKDLGAEISKKVREAENEIKLQADTKAKEILADAMLHGVTDYISEFTTSKVKLPDEDMKGKIIGKEGRNVRTFEQATGVDVVMDDEIPDTLILSSFDSVRSCIRKTNCRW